MRGLRVVASRLLARLTVTRDIHSQIQRHRRILRRARVAAVALAALALAASVTTAITAIAP